MYARTFMHIMYIPVDCLDLRSTWSYIFLHLQTMVSAHDAMRSHCCSVCMHQLETHSTHAHTQSLSRAMSSSALSSHARNLFSYIFQQSGGRYDDECNAARAGAIRWAYTIFEACDGGAWVPIRHCSRFTLSYFPVTHCYPQLFQDSPTHPPHFF